MKVNLNLLNIDVKDCIVDADKISKSDLRLFDRFVQIDVEYINKCIKSNYRIYSIICNIFEICSDSYKQLIGNYSSLNSEITYNLKQHILNDFRAAFNKLIDKYNFGDKYEKFVI